MFLALEYLFRNNSPKELLGDRSLLISRDSLGGYCMTVVQNTKNKFHVRHFVVNIKKRPKKSFLVKFQQPYNTNEISKKTLLLDYDYQVVSYNLMRGVPNSDNHWKQPMEQEVYESRSLNLFQTNKLKKNYLIFNLFCTCSFPNYSFFDPIHEKDEEKIKDLFSLQEKNIEKRFKKEHNAWSAWKKALFFEESFPIELFLT